MVFPMSCKWKLIFKNAAKYYSSLSIPRKSYADSSVLSKEEKEHYIVLKLKIDKIKITNDFLVEVIN